MEFSTIGFEDSIDEAKVRLESVDALIVWGKDFSEEWNEATEGVVQHIRI